MITFGEDKEKMGLVGNIICEGVRKPLSSYCMQYKEVKHDGIIIKSQS
jgi:hypothetical protein